MSSPRAGRRLMAIDYGRARIGLATCDELGIATRPLGFVERKGSDDAAARIVAGIAAQERIEAIVLGLPLHEKGGAGENVRWVRAFAKRLAAHCALPLIECDERHTSWEAEAALREEGEWPASPGQIDAKAAAILLRRYLDGET